jgi:molybdenum-dependent DNA-binding transcriptional regulator ModE
VNWNRKQAAKRLNICYKSLLNKLHRWQKVPVESAIPAVEAYTASNGGGH